DRAEAAAPDPGLAVADHPGVALLRAAVEECAMEVEEVVEPERSRVRAGLDRPLHGSDVAEDGPSGAVGGVRLVGGKSEPLIRRPQTLDERRTERLGTEEGCGQSPD